MRLAAAALLLVAILASAGCGSRDGGGEATQPPPAESPSPASSPPASPTPAPRATTPAANTGDGCTSFPANVQPGQTVLRRLTSSGMEREYRLHLSARAKPGDRAALVLNWHGLGSSAQEQEPYSGLVPVSDREGFVLVTPDGTGTPRGFAAFGIPINGANDVQFARDLVDTLARELCIDTARVYSTGMSNGAYMSSRLGCEIGDQIAAIAPVAGVYMPPGLPCKRAMPVLAFHGTDDAVVPFEGGLVLRLLPYSGADAAAMAWAANNPGVVPSACGNTTAVTSVISEHVERRDYEGCAGVPVGLVIVRGGGHTWPGAPDVRALGVTTHEISAAEIIWTFFKDHRLPPN